jgi:hypothetical protein
MSLETLIGFDAREMWLDNDAWWAIERRKIFLLNRATIKPLAADHAVWPSMFDLNATLSLSIPQDIRWQNGLWSSLEQLEAILKPCIDRSEFPYWLVGITQYREDDNEELLFEMGDDTTSLIDKNWDFLGFDVYDGTLLSALLNFGGDEQDMQHRAEKFASKLNEHHLFSKPEDAFEYRQWCNTIHDFVVHGPFYIFGLYHVTMQMLEAESIQ